MDETLALAFCGLDGEACRAVCGSIARQLDEAPEDAALQKYVQ